MGEPTKSRRTKDKKTPAGAGAGSAADDALDLAYNEAQSKEWGEGTFRAWWESLTPEERTAVRSYQGISYDDWNQVLRGLRAPGSGPIWEDIMARMARFRAALNKSTIPRDIYVYRGIDDARKVLGDSPSNLIGAMVTDRGFMSTSLNIMAAAKSFARTNEAAILRLRVPKGTRGAYVGISGNQTGEREITLQAGTRYRIRRVSVRQFNYNGTIVNRTVIDAEVL